MENKKNMFDMSPRKKGDKPNPFRFNLYWMYGLIFVMLIALYMTNDTAGSKDLDWTQFQKYVKENTFKDITVYNQKRMAEATVKADKVATVFQDMDPSKIGPSPKVYVKIPSADKFSDFYDKAVEENQIDTQLRFEEGEDLFWSFLVSVGPFVLIILIWFFLMRRMSGGAGPGGGGVFSVGKAKAQLFDKDNEHKVTFKDVAGLAGAKQEVEEIVSFLKNPEKYTELGGKIPKGALLVGPPGTGKTLLAKAVAGEANVPFFSLSGSDFVEMFVGVGASRVRDLFRQAKEKAPCIVFIDEIDAVGRARGRNTSMNSNDERENTLNQLLTEMDGFDGRKGVVILAATNRPESLDKALLRPGRFDRRIQMELPDLEGRKAILEVHLKKVRHRAIDLDLVARATAGSSGAELANIVNEAALLAVRQGRHEVVTSDLEESVETVIAGAQKKGKVLSAGEKRIVSYHEIGHALVAAAQSHSAPVHKITIVPRTSGALGYTMQVDSGEQVLLSREDLFNRIVTLTGGRAAEEVIIGTVSTGASNDIEQATRLARAMVTRYGMSDKYDMMMLETVNNAYLGGDTSLACSSETAAEVDREVLSVIREAHQKAKEIISGNLEIMHDAASYLLEKETITGDEFMAIVHKHQ